MKQPAPDVVVAGKYCLEGQLATGGMGSVWVARHIDLGVPVAIKFMGPDVADSEEGRIRFEREAKAAALLQSPHVVNVQDYGVDEGLAYIVMELLVGEDLCDRLGRVGRLPLEDVLTLLLQTSKALRRAQDLGIVHRDIKPQNLFIAEADDGEETVKILDFGIAKETGPTLLAKGTNTGQIIGSPHYMSPEAVRGARDIDHRSDLWSLAVIVFEAITGRLPFDSEIVGDVMGMILADPLPKATDVAPDLPPEIDAFFEKALARDRNKRFQSAKEMTQAFAEIVRGPVSESSLFPASSRPPPVVMIDPGEPGPDGVVASARTGAPEPPSGKPSSGKPPGAAAGPSSEEAAGAAANAASPGDKGPGGAGSSAASRKPRILVGALAVVAVGGAAALALKLTGDPTGAASGAPAVAQPLGDSTSAEPTAGAGSSAGPAAASAAPAAEPASSNTSSAQTTTPPSDAPPASASADADDKPAPAWRPRASGVPAPKPSAKKPKKSWGF